MACTIDFRFLDEGFGGKTAKRKREAANNPGDDGCDMVIDTDTIIDPPSKRSAIACPDNPDKPIFGKPNYNGVIAGRVSGRNWKQVRTHRASASRISIKGTNYEVRAKEKEVKRAYKERMNELKEEIRRNKQEKRKQREEREKRKQENILKSGTKLQKITNPNTLKKISKSKDRKLLKVVPDEFISRGKDSKGKKK